MSEILRPGAAILPFDWSAGAVLSAGSSNPLAIRAASEQFEALLVGQLLRSMREAGGGGWLGADEHDASSTLMEMAEQCLAAALAAQGGLGLARIVERGLAAQSPPGGAAGS